MDWPPEGLEFNTQSYPRVHQINEYLPNPSRDRIRVCRCWQSKKFPFCDDTHKQLMEAGDDVGPMVFIYRHQQKAAVPFNRYAPMTKIIQDSSSNLAPACAVGAICFGLGIMAGMKYKMHNWFDSWFGGGGNNGSYFEHIFITPDYLHGTENYFTTSITGGIKIFTENAFKERSQNQWRNICGYYPGSSWWINTITSSTETLSAGTGETTSVDLNCASDDDDDLNCVTSSSIITSSTGGTFEEIATSTIIHQQQNNNTSNSQANNILQNNSNNSSSEENNEEPNNSIHPDYPTKER